MSDPIRIQRGPGFMLRASFIDGSYSSWPSGGSWEELFRRPVEYFEVLRENQSPSVIVVDMMSGGIQFDEDPAFFADNSQITNRRPIFAVMKNGTLLLGWQGNDSEGTNHRFTIQL